MRAAVKQAGPDLLRLGDGVIPILVAFHSWRSGNGSEAVTWVLAGSFIRRDGDEGAFDRVRGLFDPFIGDFVGDFDQRGSSITQLGAGDLPSDARQPPNVVIEDEVRATLSVKPGGRGVQGRVQGFHDLKANSYR